MPGKIDRLRKLTEDVFADAGINPATLASTGPVPNPAIFYFSLSPKVMRKLKRKKTKRMKLLPGMV